MLGKPCLLSEETYVIIMTESQSMEGWSIIEEREVINSKKNRIREAAIKVLSLKGLEKTKVSDVVKEAGVAQGTFYLYYESKNALVPDIAEKMLLHMLKEMKGRISEEEPFRNQLKNIIEITFEITYLYRDVLGLCYSGMATTGFFQEWEQIYIPYYEWLEERIEKAQRRKDIRQDMQPSMIAKILVELMEGIAEQAYLFEGKKDKVVDYQKDLMNFSITALKCE